MCSCVVMAGRGKAQLKLLIWHHSPIVVSVVQRSSSVLGGALLQGDEAEAAGAASLAICKSESAQAVLEVHTGLDLRARQIARSVREQKQAGRAEISWHRLRAPTTPWRRGDVPSKCAVTEPCPKNYPGKGNEGIGT